MLSYPESWGSAKHPGDLGLGVQGRLAGERNLSLRHQDEQQSARQMGRGEHSEERARVRKEERGGGTECG